MGRIDQKYGCIARKTVSISLMAALLVSGTLLSGCSLFSKDTEPVEIEPIPVEVVDVSDTEEELSADSEKPAGTFLEEQEEKLELSEEAAEPIDMLAFTPGEVIEINEDQLDAYFCAYEIPDSVFERINGRSYRENPNISLDELRYMKVIHYNFNHETQVGELIVNAALEQDYLEIFRALYDAEYEIQSMYLVDNYWTGDGDSSDSASIDQNNTSAFCYRTATGSGNLSKHAFGRAIDINPQQNPYVSYASGAPHWSHSNANQYIDRTTGLPHVITHDDYCYQLFIEHGFTWGGDWDTVKDYQHFEKAY